MIGEGDIYWPTVHVALEKLNINWDNSTEFWNSFGNLEEKEKLLTAAHFCDAEICNGGFHQLFFNSTGILAKHAQRAFLNFGMPNTSAIFDKALLWFPEGDIPIRERRIEKLISHRATVELQVPNARRSDWDPFNDFDELYYQLREEENGGFLFSADRFSTS